MSPAWLSTLWPWALVAVAIYCLVQTVRDWRARNYRMMAAGILCLILLALTPIQSSPFKLDLPARS